MSSQEEKIEVVYQEGTPGDIHGIFADITQMNNIFGDWEKVDLKDGIAEMIKSCK